MTRPQQIYHPKVYYDRLVSKLLGGPPAVAALVHEMRQAGWSSKKIGLFFLFSLAK